MRLRDFRRPALAALGAIALLAGAGGPIRAEEAKGGEPLPSDLVEESETHLVQLNLLALDDDGAPVLDLAPEDLRLVVNGEDVPIAFLERYGVVETVVERPAEPVPETPAEPEPRAAPRTLAFMVDLFAASPRARAQGLEALQVYTEEMHREGDRVSLFTFDGRLNVVLKMSTDRSEIRSAVEELRRSGATKSWANPIRDLDDLLVELPRCRAPRAGFDSIVSCANSLARAYENSRTFATERYLEALIALTGALSAMPGSKVVIVFSEGFTRFPGIDARKAVEATLGTAVAERIYFTAAVSADFGFKRLVDAAADARVSLFTVNPQYGQSLSSVSPDRPREVELLQLQGPRQGIDMVRFVQRGAQQSLDEIARETGGASLRTPDGVRGVGTILERAEGLYTLGFYKDPKRRSEVDRIRIETLREDVKVTRRRTISHVRDRAPVEGDLRVSPGGCDASGTREVTLNVDLERSSFEYEKIGRYYRANFAFYLRLLVPGQSEPVFEQYRLFNAKHTRSDRREGRVQDPVIEQRLRVPCTDLVVRVTVTDLSDGSRGEFDGVISGSGG